MEGFYENEFPKEDDFVMVRVIEIDQSFVKVILLEYGKEAYIQLNELSSRRIRNIRDIVQLDKEEVCIVTKVDPEKGYIDVSRKNISPEDIEICQSAYKLAKQAHNLLMRVSRNSDVSIQTLYTQVAWPWMAENNQPLYNLFITKSFSSIPTDLHVHFETVSKTLVPKLFQVDQGVKLMCIGYEGIDAIKSKIREGLNSVKNPYTVRIRLVTSPTYRIEVTGPDIAGCQTTVSNVVESMKRMMATFDGGMCESVSEIKEEDDD